ncbi:hypothetical protein FRB96_005997 [Tulasnella sp. 330]|nr:hypothetical protein FRB96_005997 [Tulasnella sp. 330]KAG8882137.1 hypothetical protein FRB97_008625 [Tulasnella sp. 331]KAG8887740.1 hypothetical protein FRB98_009124 [Tulasnella sp. 332]
MSSSPIPLEPFNENALNFKLPELVESQRQSWISYARTAGFAALFLCGVETKLISIVRSHGQGNAPAFTYQVLLIFSYSALIFNMSAAISAFITIDRLGDMPNRIKKRFDSQELPPSEVRYDHLLEDFGVGTACLWMKKHCVFALFAGTWCMFWQIFLYICMQEAQSVWITMSFVFGIAISPWLALLLKV